MVECNRFSSSFFLLSTALLACGGLVRSDATDDTSSGSIHSAAANNEPCATEWNVLFEESTTIAVSSFELPVPLPPGMAIASENLIFRRVVDDQSYGTVALSIDGGSTERIVDHEGYDAIWSVEEEVFALHGQTLRRLQLGTSESQSETLLSTATTDSEQTSVRMVISADWALWLASDKSGTPSLWRQSLTSSDADLLTSLDPEYSGGRIAFGDGVVVVSGSSSSVAVQAKAPHTTELLESVFDGEIVGVDGRGVMWKRIGNSTRQGGEANEYELLLAQPNGNGIRKVWSGRAGQIPRAVWPNESGWFVTGSFNFGGGDWRSVILQLDEDGTQRVLACDPSGGSFVGRPQRSSKGLLSFYRSEPNGAWSIVKIPR